MSVEPVRIPEISEAVLREVDRFRGVFENAAPFKHVMIENFFESSFAAKLLEEFPSFRQELARNEVGLAGGKAVNTKIREISPSYLHLYDLISSPAFLDFASRLSGIPDLILDPAMYGGGTHDNQHGQELDPHVDFNYDESRQLHRRLNLIVYMNPEWESGWGGAIEIHSNPRKPFENQVTAFDPIFNRCVMFETNEYSWHGFPKINLPEDKRHLSRKSISVYLYTRERPAAEVVPEHGTFYVQRFLPPALAPGHTLTAEEFGDLQRLLIRRDSWIEHYQAMEIEKNRRLAIANQELEELRRRIRAPLTGYVLQSGSSAGLYSDGWVAPEVKLEIAPQAPVSSLVFRGYRPDFMPPGRLSITVNNTVQARAALGKQHFEVPVKFKTPLQETLHVSTLFEPESGSANFVDQGRELAFVLLELRALHPHGKHPGL